MRRETSEIRHDPSACYGAGTRVEVHRSRYELERVLHRYGAHDVLFVEADANASIQFAMQGRFVQLALPLPDPANPRFTHTPSGKPRALAAQERAYDQALREHWRSLVVAVRGKLQSVESGISTFEQEFDRFLVPHFAEEKKRSRKAPKAVNWLLGGSHSVAIALVAAFLVPASAVGAFALPANVVGSLATPFRSAVDDVANAGSSGADGLALARGGWAPSNDDGFSEDAARLFASRSADQRGVVDTQLRETANLTAPPDDGIDAPRPVPAPELAAVATSALSSPGETPAPPAPPRGSDTSKPSDSNSGGDAPPPAVDTPAPPSESTDSDPQGPAEEQSPGTSETPSAGESVDAPVSDEPGPDQSAGGAPEPGTDAPPAPGNGNGNGNGNGGTPPGQAKKDDPTNTPPGQSSTPPGQSSTPPGQSNTPPGQANNPGNNGNPTPPGQEKKGNPKGGK